MSILGLTPGVDPIKLIFFPNIFPFFAGKLACLLHKQKKSIIVKLPTVAYHPKNEGKKVL